MHRTRLLINAINVSSLRLLGQVFALVSGLLIANHFGATDATDDYYTALILPGALANLVINSLTNLFAPIYLQHVHDDPEQGDRILGSMMFVVSIALLAATIISLLAVPLYTNARPLEPGDGYMRALLFGFLLAINCPLIGYARLLGVYCETRQHYSVPAAAAVLSPILFIVTFLLCLPLGIYSLLIANLTAAAFEALILTIYTSRRLNLKLSPSVSVHPAVREMLQQSFTSAVAFLALFLIPTIDRLMITSLDAGSLTAFHYGERIIVALEALVIGGPLLVVHYHWANVNATQNIEAVAYSVPDLMSLISFMLAPVYIIGAVLRYPIIAVLFGHGEFTAIEASANVFSILLLSEGFYFLTVMVIRLTMLMKRTKLQAVLSVGMAVFNILFNLLFLPLFGLVGIALSTLAMRIIVATISLVFLKRQLPTVQFRLLLPRLAQTIVCIVTMLIGLLVVQQLLLPLLERTQGVVLQAFSVVITGFASVLVYILTAFIIKHNDFLALLKNISKSRYGRFFHQHTS